jgi:hypothetical protein
MPYEPLSLTEQSMAHASICSFLGYRVGRAYETAAGIFSQGNTLGKRVRLLPERCSQANDNTLK